ncbi:MAG: MerR family transcriptional regulator [Deltaproteobacteria bacterium]|nr:MerR family transcriptional regulator [Deltaproteobacteria bacterium]
MQGVTIGVLAKKLGIGVETIRFYEREGLIKQPKVFKNAGYRRYEPELVQRLYFIRKAKGLGFSLKEIRELLDLRALKKEKCGSVKTKAEQKLSEVNDKIRDLIAVKEALAKLIATCHLEATTSECPILDALNLREDL